ncbi:MAG: SusD/RagB family nutrient-binding outer membrane lipoprotein [Phaeodactylibacter sp.]|uniref:SusD/RagB family nutrient-binding outer membrane lipoprotein n=1 Tax=Phaeodactylibacter sp. TaxID=1940289 RepID=UPI0032EB6790
MKFIFQYKYALLLSVLFVGATACDDITDLNVDPNNPIDVPAINLVTEAEYQVNRVLWSRGYNAEWTMLCVQHWAQNEYAEESRYTVDGNNFNVQWVDFYSDVLRELDVAEQMINDDETLNEGQRANQTAIIEILMVHTFHSMVDAYGDLPYTEALKSIEFPLPAYDTQQSIYMDLLARMEVAVNSLDPTAGSFSSGELIYNGDVDMWRKLGNSLMMRMAMRIVDVDESTAKSYIAKAAEGGMLESNEDNALFAFSDDPNIANPLFIDATINNRDDFAVTDVLVNNLTDMGDPRLGVFAAPTNSGDIVGMPYGLTDGEAFALKSTTSRPSGLVREATAPAVIMDYAEVKFLEAEAVQRGVLTGDAAAAYAEGVEASMNYWGITDEAAIANYVAANPYDANNWKESLGWQKWIAFYMNGPQAWAEWRRLDYPQLEVPAAATNDVIPVRLPYPISEQTRNNSSLQAVTSTPNDLSSKLWWDVN